MREHKYAVAAVDADGTVQHVTEQTVFVYEDDPPTIDAEFEAHMHNNLVASDPYLTTLDATGDPGAIPGKKIGQDWNPRKPAPVAAGAKKNQQRPQPPKKAVAP